jgi:hypothetical protein
LDRSKALGPQSLAMVADAFSDGDGRSATNHVVMLHVTIQLATTTGWMS